MGSTRRTWVALLDQVRGIVGWVFSFKTQTRIWGAVLIALAVTWSTHWLGPGPATRSDSPSISMKISGEPVSLEDNAVMTSVAASRIRFPDWQQLIKTPTDEATRRSLVENFRGETVTWEGYFDEVHEISPEYRDQASNCFLLSMYESETVRKSTALGRAPALCMLSESARNQISDLKPGQRMIIKGTLAAPETLNGTLLGTRVYNCEILLR